MSILKYKYIFYILYCYNMFKFVCWCLKSLTLLVFTTWWETKQNQINMQNALTYQITSSWNVFIKSFIIYQTPFANYQVSIYVYSTWKNVIFTPMLKWGIKSFIGICVIILHLELESNCFENLYYLKFINDKIIYI